jgi:PiT family inorganic phosphate transporter
LSDYPFLVTIVLVALVFDFLNGFHDAANAIATVVSTRVLSPRKAVIFAGFFDFVAAFLVSREVAKTVGQGMIDISVVTHAVVLAGLIGAIAWNLITWYWGLPVSSSHALLGGYAGAAIARAGMSALIPGGWVMTVSFIVISPLIGLVLGFVLTIAGTWVFRHWAPFRLDRLFRKLQLVSAALYSIGHGSNDAQKTMGIITGILFASGHLKTFDVPTWVILVCNGAIATGTMCGGWRIVKTMGTKITKLKPMGAFSADTAAAITLFINTFLGIPVSTTHTITGAIMGVGSLRRRSAVRWGVAYNIVWAWILTIPCSALLGAVLEFVIRPFIRQ